MVTLLKLMTQSVKRVMTGAARCTSCHVKYLSSLLPSCRTLVMKRFTSVCGLESAHIHSTINNFFLILREISIRPVNAALC